VINEFSKFKESKAARQSSQACVVGNIPWKILARSKQREDKSFVIEFYLQCLYKNDTNDWAVKPLPSYDF
jgi:hypothetical protein